MSSNKRDPKGNDRTTGAGRGARYTSGPAGGGMAAPMSWDSVNSEVLSAAVGAVTARGDAILLGTTSDGGALVIQVFAGADKPKWYFPRVEDAEKHLAWLEKTARAD